MYDDVCMSYKYMCIHARYPSVRLSVRAHKTYTAHIASHYVACAPLR